MSKDLFKSLRQRSERRQALEKHMTERGLSDEEKQYFKERLYRKESEYTRLRRMRLSQKSFENIKLKKGVSFVEIVSNCNSGWKMTPNDSNIWMEENMFPYFPLGDIKVNGNLK